MSWVYDQKSGDLHFGDIYEGRCYSGHGEGVNNPAMEAVPNVGPIPKGRYRIGPPQTHPHLGKLAFPLTPLAGTETHGRSGFFIHGDNTKADHSASEGCIIAGHSLRVEITSTMVRSGLNDLEVV